MILSSTSCNSTYPLQRRHINRNIFYFGQREWQKTNNKLNGKTARNKKHRSRCSANFFTLRRKYHCINISTSRNGSLNSNHFRFNLKEYATSASDFQMTNVPVEMLYSICAVRDHLNNINFPETQDYRMNFWSGGCLHSNSTTRIHNKATGILTELGRIVKGTIPQKLKPTSNKQKSITTSRLTTE